MTPRQARSPLQSPLTRNNTENHLRVVDRLVRLEADQVLRAVGGSLDAGVVGLGTGSDRCGLIMSVNSSAVFARRRKALKAVNLGGIKDKTRKNECLTFCLS